MLESAFWHQLKRKGGGTMQPKVPSEITQISLNDATYKDCGVSIQPTLVNFFFGNNGTGKSTVAKAIKADNGTTWRTGKSATDYNIHVYNQDFIIANLQTYHNMPGVFTVNEVNIEIQKQIEDKTTEKETASTALGIATEGKKKKEEANTSLFSIFQDECWDKTKDLRETFDGTQTGKKRKHQFAEAILEIKTPKEHDRAALKRLYDAAYASDSKRYDEFKIITDTSALDKLDGIDILCKSIVSSATTPFAEFIKALNATAWVRQGHEQYHETPENKCSYCQQKLPEKFEDDIKACFDAQYQSDTIALKDFYDTYKQKANEIFAPLQSVPQDLYHEIEIVPYNDKLAALKGIISSNLQQISEKIADPSITINIDDTEPTLKELNDIINGFNKLISENNAVIAAKPKKQAECKISVWELLAFSVKDEINRYNTSKTALEKEINAFSTQITANKNAVQRITGEISDLNRQIVSTKATIDSVNTLLRDSGFQGFSIREKVGTPNVYEVIRPNGSIAENLSEGERNFIAFLYFYHLVRGSETADGGLRDKIVVIDDPVSSMDSSSLFIVSALIREMIEICENNAEEREYIVQGNFIKQIFILTHNAYFHREVTYNQVRHYQYVNFYLICKVDNKSSIRLCEDQNPDIPSEKININPVQNSYAALWDEYKEVKSAIPLMNVIRRILEYYFLQLCGYDGAILRKRILVDNKDSFISHKEDGSLDTTQYQMASAMLSYISANSIGINDGMNYVDDCIDVVQSRETFEMIFKFMSQEQHYKMMMGIK
jgi:wobble nucleotide-excising tRNase